MPCGLTMRTAFLKPLHDPGGVALAEAHRPESDGWRWSRCASALGVRREPGALVSS